MNKFLFALIFLIGCDASLGNKTSDSGNDTVLNESADCQTCGDDPESLGIRVDLEDCNQDFCGDEDDCDPIDEAAGCRERNADSFDAVVTRCLEIHHCSAQ